MHYHNEPGTWATERVRMGSIPRSPKTWLISSPYRRLVRGTSLNWFPKPIYLT
ncbi:hypothetical protein WDU94_007341, partial [Cyamophila willieti]